MSEWERVIFHADMDAFFAAVEERHDPSLKGRPLIVGARPGARGVVSTANYAARAYGIHSAMPISEAYRLCPGGVFLPVNHSRYMLASRAVFAIFERFSSLVEGASIDEAYLEVSDRAIGEPGGPEAYARKLKMAVLDETGLTVSIGVAANKLVAKVASDSNKPDGLVVVEPGTEAAFLSGFPVRALPGIGPQTQERLSELGIESVGELAAVPQSHLERSFNASSAEYLQSIARGLDESPLYSHQERKQIGRDETFRRDLATDSEVRGELRKLCAAVVEDLKAASRKTRNLTVRVRFANFSQTTRTYTLYEPTDSLSVIEEIAGVLVGKIRSNDRRRIRLLGVTARELSHPSVQQLALMDEDE